MQSWWVRVTGSGGELGDAWSPDVIHLCSLSLSPTVPRLGSLVYGYGPLLLLLMALVPLMITLGFSETMVPSFYFIFEWNLWYTVWMLGWITTCCGPFLSASWYMRAPDASPFLVYLLDSCPDLELKNGPTDDSNRVWMSDGTPGWTVFDIRGQSVTHRHPTVL